MEIDIGKVRDRAAAYIAGRSSHHTAENRRRPSKLRFDFLLLDALTKDIAGLLARVPEVDGAAALDLGSSLSPYRDLLERKGFTVRCLDIAPGPGVDLVGTIEATNLARNSFDLVICTQVAEHVPRPWHGMMEISRILRPGGHVILTVPHVWFYHPHPSDYWRFTQEGLLRMCEEAGLLPETLLAQGGTVRCGFQILNFLVYGVLGRFGAPVYLPVNLVGSIADRILRNDLFCLNFAVLAQKPSA